MNILATAVEYPEPIPPEVTQRHRSVSQGEAAVLLGITRATLRRLIKEGFVRAFHIPHRIVPKLIRVRLEELNRLMTENDCSNGLVGRNRSDWINPHTARKIPVCLAARILGMKATAVSEACQRGTLYLSPEGLLEYILHRHKKELTTQIRLKYKSKILLLQKQVTYSKRKLKECRRENG